jgi:uncharacterized cupredoxin-like copper-binding protein
MKTITKAGEQQFPGHIPGHIPGHFEASMVGKVFVK